MVCCGASSASWSIKSARAPATVTCASACGPGDWIAIGNLEPKGSQPEFCRVPKIKDAKFGRKVSAIGDGTLKYTGVRIVHAQFDADPLV